MAQRSTMVVPRCALFWSIICSSSLNISSVRTAKTATAAAGTPGSSGGSGSGSVSPSKSIVWGSGITQHADTPAKCVPRVRSAYLLRWLSCAFFLCARVHAYATLCASGL